MDDAVVIDIVTEAMAVAAKLAGPALVVSLVLGVVISLLQTVTQIQEATLTFVPKMVGVGLLLLVAGSWMLSELTSWVEQLWGAIPEMV